MSDYSAIEANDQKTFRGLLDFNDMDFFKLINEMCR